MVVERKFIEEAVREVGIHEYFASRLSKAGYDGMQVSRTPLGTRVTIRAERPGMIIGKGGKIIKNLTEDLKTHFKFENPQIDVQEIPKPELSARIMANRLAHAMERGWHFRRAGFMVQQQIMDAGALGCEIVITGKLTGPRARRVKYVRGYVPHSGQPSEVVLRGIAAARRKEGALGIKVRILPPGILPGTFKIKRPEEPASPAPEAKPEGSGS
ncbi:MAG: 30S ribosomal protein S3 [Halobacteria archaeon]